jgi:hypothetical protein
MTTGGSDADERSGAPADLSTLTHVVVALECALSERLRLLSEHEALHLARKRNEAELARLLATLATLVPPEEVTVSGGQQAA